MDKDNKLEEIKELIKQDVKDIQYHGQMTTIEFENGQLLPLYGGVAGIEQTTQKIPECSFCGNESKEGKPLVSLNDKNDPLICPDCAIETLKTFIENGIEIELDLSSFASEELIEEILNNEENLSK